MPPDGDLLDGGWLARWVEWRQRGLGPEARPVAAIGVDERPHTVFVEDELLIPNRDQELSAELRDRWQTEIVEEPPVPPPPPEREAANAAAAEEFPRPIRHRLTAPPDFDREELDTCCLISAIGPR